MMLKEIAFLAVIVLVCVSFALAQAKTSDAITKQFIELQRGQDEAEGKKDIAALDRFFNDDFIFIAANGSVHSKTQFLDELKADTEPPSDQKLEYEDFKVRVYDKIAVANYVLAVPQKDKDGKNVVNRFRMSVIWVKNKGMWRITTFHATRVRN